MRGLRRTLPAAAAAVLALSGVSSAAAEPGTRPSPPTRTTSGLALAQGEHPTTSASGGRRSANPRAGGPGAPEQPTLSTVTLVTGDRVRLTTGPDGVKSVVPMPAAGRSGIAFSIRHRGNEIQVVPSDAAPLLLNGRLDRRLFDVAGLVAAGYGDAKTSRIPLIVRSTAGRFAAMAAPRGAAVSRTLASVSATAVSTRKNEAAAFWRWLAGKPSATSAPLAAGQAGRTTLAGGIEKVWLDGPVHGTLDRSVPQTGAPKAWKLGYTGKGVKVAVLDTGIDADHPDLSGAVVAARSFVGGASGTDDRNGHGTHVAATITGSGAASTGRYKGMAPDATLVNAKVLNDDAGGTESGVIAGMEWAAGQGAKVANLSLSSNFATDGTDPVSLALNRISAQKGTLFVVAAGNAGPSEQTIGSPGSADSALTVGAVDSAGTTADFSGRGPRLHDYALKPEIAAPGVGIVSARAEGSTPDEPVGSAYARMSGTSMAAPHVTGGAALLAQLRPTWTPAQLKAMLVGTAKPKAGEGAFDQGAGQLDAGRALTQRVSTDRASLSFGLTWPHTGVTARKLTYRNTTAAPITLNLSASLVDVVGEPAPSGLFRLDRTTLLVPARSTAQATVIANPAKARPGESYSGRITATAGGIAVQTPVATYVEAEAYDLTIKATDRNGALINRLDQSFLAPPVVADPETEEVYPLRAEAGGLTARVPPGRYTFGEIVVTQHGLKPPSFTHLARPEIVVDRNVTVRLDARAAKQVRASVEAMDAKPVVTTFGTVELVGGFPWTTLVNLPGTQRFPMFALPTAPVTNRAYMFTLFQALDSSRGVYELVLGRQGQVPANPSYQVRDADLTRIQSRFAAGGVGLDVEGVWFREAELPRDVTIGLGWFYEVPIPSTKAHLFTARFDSGENLNWSDNLDVRRDASQVWYTEFGEARTYLPGQRVNRTWSPAAYRPRGDGNRGSGGGMSMWFAPFAPSLTGGSVAVWDPSGIEGAAVLRRDGKVVAESVDPFVLDAEGQPGQQSTYTLDLTADRRVPWSTYATKVTGHWVFSSSVPVEDVESMSLLNVMATGSFDAYGRAPAGKVFRLNLPAAPGAGGGVIAGLELSVSYDDGRTWKQVPVTVQDTGRRIADISHPPTPGAFVSLKVRAWDNKGNRVDLTSIRAYGLFRTAS